MISKSLSRDVKYPIDNVTFMNNIVLHVIGSEPRAAPCLRHFKSTRLAISTKQYVFKLLTITEIHTLVVQF